MPSLSKKTEGIISSIHSKTWQKCPCIINYLRFRLYATKQWFTIISLKFKSTSKERLGILIEMTKKNKYLYSIIPSNPDLLVTFIYIYNYDVILKPFHNKNCISILPIQNMAKVSFERTYSWHWSSFLASFTNMCFLPFFSIPTFWREDLPLAKS